jgi:hypothetical protein
MKYDNIKSHYKEIIKNYKFYNSLKPTRDVELLLPEFYNLLIYCFNEYRKKYPNQYICIIQTYRSNTLQLKHFKEGKSKIRKNGMHHYGIAADVAFLIDDKVSFKGDYGYLRKIFKENKLTILDWELGHVQYIPVSEQNTLRKEIGN